MGSYSLISNRSASALNTTKHNITLHPSWCICSNSSTCLSARSLTTASLVFLYPSGKYAVVEMLMLEPTACVLPNSFSFMFVQSTGLDKGTHFISMIYLRPLQSSPLTSNLDLPNVTSRLNDLTFIIFFKQVKLQCSNCHIFRSFRMNSYYCDTFIDWMDIPGQLNNMRCNRFGRIRLPLLFWTYNNRWTQIYQPRAPQRRCVSHLGRGGCVKICIIECYVRHVCNSVCSVIELSLRRHHRDIVLVQFSFITWDWTHKV